jgi:hypothetical protein
LCCSEKIKALKVLKYCQGQGVSCHCNARANWVMAVESCLGSPWYWTCDTPSPVVLRASPDAVSKPTTKGTVTSRDRHWCFGGLHMRGCGFPKGSKRSGMRLTTKQDWLPGVMEV